MSQAVTYTGLNCRVILGINQSSLSAHTKDQPSNMPKSYTNVCSPRTICQHRAPFYQIKMNGSLVLSRKMPMRMSAGQFKSQWRAHQ